MLLLFRQSLSRLKPLELLPRIMSASEDCFLLESATGPAHSARYSFLGASPSVKAVCNGDTVSFDGRKRKQRIDRFLEEEMAQRKMRRRIPFPYTGGFVGYFSYDVIRSFEKLPDKHSPSSFPDAELGLFEDGFIYDNLEEKLFYFSTGDDRERELIGNDAVHEDVSYGSMSSHPQKSRYLDAVDRAKEYIVDGDIFQVVLSRRRVVDGMKGMISFYRRLKAVNPSPYMYFVKFGDRTVIGSSPETLVRVEGRKIVTYPIAGTRPASKDKKENDRLRTELLNDEKEKAEHNMLVDLARNDVGRVSDFGTVRVPEYMNVERYSHVQHIVSRVEGRLSSSKTPVDALFSIFPAGTVSGAPKIRAMEIIEELEPFRRGPYAGAVGYYSFNGYLDSAISIRTLFCERDRAFLQAGGGIVYDSDPEKEFTETENKMGALLSVYGRDRT
ncbi:MAG: anthranilate synthase component I family protein [Methanomassiliicoccales archaeon]|nr:anthranilate synthase component I family protein [Methanomassiliicoccales archaeon]